MLVTPVLEKIVNRRCNALTASSPTLLPLVVPVWMEVKLRDSPIATKPVAFVLTLAPEATPIVLVLKVLTAWQMVFALIAELMLIAMSITLGWEMLTTTEFVRTRSAYLVVEVTEIATVTKIA